MSPRTEQVISVSPTRLPCLDGLRACAIALVVLCHGRSQIAVALPPMLDGLIVKYWGTLGVELFFGLSGYLITFLLLREHAATGGISLGKFYMRRSLRILPPLFLFLAVIVALNLTDILQVPWKSIAAGALFLQNYNFGGDAHSDARFVGHLWSLAAEEQFYLLWPLAVAWLGPKRIRSVALVLALAAPIIRIGHYFLFPGLRGEITTMFHTTYDRFLWGCLLALGARGGRMESFVGFFRSSIWLCLVLSFFLLWGPLLDACWGGYYGLPIGLTLRAWCIVFVIAWLSQHAGSWPAKWLDSGPMKAIGVVSYSVYLWQELFMGKGQHTFSDYFFVGVGATLAAAGLAYILAEKPFIEIRRRLNPSGPRNPDPVIAASSAR